MKLRDIFDKTTEDAVLGEEATPKQRKVVRWLAALLLIAVVVALASYCSRAMATGYEVAPPPHFGGSSTATGGAGGAGGAGGVGGAGGLGGAGGSSGPVSVGVGGDSYSSKAWAVGTPSFANGALTCEAGIPLIGGTYEREACAILRDAAAMHGTLPAGAGRDEAIKEVLCYAPRIRAAYAVTGRPCANVER